MHIRGLHRWQAFLVHLGISLIIFIALLAIIILLWYPGVFIHMGAWQGIQIVIAVDLVLGPLLTLIVFNPTKKSLPIDLSIIAIIQLSCLGYGVWAIEQQRPLVQAILDDELRIIPKAQYTSQGISLEFLKNIPGSIPKMVILNLPNDHASVVGEVIAGLVTNNPLHLQTSKYIPVLSAKNQPAHKEKLEWRLDRLEFDQKKGCYWLPADSPYFKGEVCFNTNHGAIHQRPPSSTDRPEKNANNG